MSLDDWCFFFFFWDCCVSQDNSYFDGMIVVCRRMINASFLRFSTCHREIRLLMAWSLCFTGWSMPFFFFFAIVACRRAIHLLICDCYVLQSNSSFDLQLLHFARQFVFWILITAFRKTICLLVLQLLCFARQFVFWFATATFCDYYVLQGNSSFDFAITMFRRTIRLLMAWSLRVVGRSNASFLFAIATFRKAIVFWWHDRCVLLKFQCICFVIAACCWKILFRWHDRYVSLDDEFIFWERNPRITSFFEWEISGSCIQNLLPKGDLYSVMKYKKEW